MGVGGGDELAHLLLGRGRIHLRDHRFGRGGAGADRGCGWAQSGRGEEEKGGDQGGTHEELSGRTPLI